MLSESIGWGIVGTGWAADELVAPAINADRRSRIVAVASRKSATGRSFADRHRAARSYLTYSQLLSDPEVRVIYIATPHSLHADAVVGAAKAGKHVLCEKPLALNSSEARLAVRACSAARVLLGVNFQSRHHPGINRTKQLLRQGAIGRPVYAQVEVAAGTEAPAPDWRQRQRLVGLGAIHAVGVHAYDLLMHLLEAPVLRVTAAVQNEEPSQLDNVAISILHFANGVLATVTATQRLHTYRPQINITGTAGRLVIEADLPFLDGTFRLVTSSDVRIWRYKDKDVFARTVRRFNDAVLRGGAVNASGEDGLRSAHLVEAIVRSAQIGRSVQVRSARR